MNGRPAELGERADPKVDRITVDGQPLPGPAAAAYLALNKPAGYACTRRDPHLPVTVYNLLPRLYGHLFTVGRLDVDTEGLLLLTNDGEWANGIAHPRRHVPKVYLADVSPEPSREDLDALRRGVRLDDGLTLPARARLIQRMPNEERARVELTITEGRKRQVRRMFGALDFSVLRLQRTAIGAIQLGALPPGRWRPLTEAEVDSLRLEDEA